MWSCLMIVLVALVGLGYGQSSQGLQCTFCDREKCPEVTNCEGGAPVLDGCGCCSVCPKKEHELCDHPDVPFSGVYNGKCGDNMECRIRDDLEDGDVNEAICYCLQTEAVCGDDGETYDSICQLQASANKQNIMITVKHKGPCRKVPKIVSAPERTKDVEGSNIALVCEATGYPIPVVEWTFTRVDGKTIHLPSDDLHISVNMRGGPEKWQITGWLQVMEMEKEHEGDYTCIAQNELGMDQASARINVIVDEKSEFRKKRRKTKKFGYSDKSFNKFN